MMGLDISKPIRRDLGTPWGKTTKGTEKAKVEALSFIRKLNFRL